MGRAVRGSKCSSVSAAQRRLRAGHLCEGCEAHVHHPCQRVVRRSHREPFIALKGMEIDGH